MRATKTIVLTSLFCFFSAVLSFGQINIKVPKLPKVPKEIKLGKKDKKSTSEKQNDSDSPSTDSSPDKNISSLTKPQCVKDSEGKVVRFNDKLNHLADHLKENLIDNYFTTKFSDLERSHRSLLRSLESCKQSNPSFNFDETENAVNESSSDFHEFDKTRQECENWANIIEQKRYKLQEYKNYFDYYPGSFLGISEDDTYVTFTLKDKAFFTEPAVTSGVFYENQLLSGLNLIKEIEEYINSNEFSEKSYKFLDGAYEDFGYDKNKGIVEVSRRLSELEEIQNGLFPSNPKLAEIVNYAKRLETKMGGKKSAALDAIVVSQFHKENLNKIFFTSNVNLDPKLATASDFKTNFVIGDQIKGIAFLDEKMGSEYGNEYYLPEFSIESSGNKNRFGLETYKKGDGSKAYIEFYISLNSGNYKPTPGTYCATAISMQYLVDLAPRNHTLKVSFSKGTEPTGSFSFDVTSDEGMAKVKSEIGKIRNIHLADVPLPKAKMVNSTYQKQLVSMFNSIGWEETFKKAIISSSEWNYVKSYNGTIVGRTLAVYMVSTKNGSCMYQDFTVIQDKTGSGYGGFKIHGTGGQSDISCGKVN